MSLGNPLQGRVCLVTGGVRGIGRAVAVHLAAAGAIPIVTYRSEEDAAEKTRGLLAQVAGTSAPTALVLRADLEDRQAVTALVARISEQFGRLDTLVNNAGRTFDGAFAALSPDDYAPVLRTNLAGTIGLTLACVPLLRDSRGTVVVLSSLAGVTGKEGQVVYSTTKAGLIGFTRLLARRLGVDGIRVNAIAPGFIRTDMVNALPESTFEHIIGATALRCMGEPEEVASSVAFLASAQSSYVNGTVLRIDGGFHR